MEKRRAQSIALIAQTPVSFLLWNRCQPLQPDKSKYDIVKQEIQLLDAACHYYKRLLLLLLLDAAAGNRNVD